MKKDDIQLPAVIGFKSDKNLDRSIGKRFERQMITRMKLYRCDALDATHDLAMMPITDSWSQNQVKLHACKVLIDGLQATPGAPVETTDLMAQLNEQFHSTKKRIKEIRERVVTFEDEQPTSSVILDVSPSQDSSP